MKLKLSIALLSLAALAFGSVSAFAAAGAVYTLNNSSSGNAVLIFSLGGRYTFCHRNGFNQWSRFGRRAWEPRRAGHRY